MEIRSLASFCDRPKRPSFALRETPEPDARISVIQMAQLVRTLILVHVQLDFGQVWKILVGSIPFGQLFSVRMRSFMCKIT